MKSGTSIPVTNTWAPVSATLRSGKCLINDFVSVVVFRQIWVKIQWIKEFSECPHFFPLFMVLLFNVVEIEDSSNLPFAAIKECSCKFAVLSFKFLNLSLAIRKKQTNRQ